MNKKILILFMCALLFVGGLRLNPLASEIKNEVRFLEKNEAKISVSATAKREAKPDKAKFWASVTTKSTNAAKAAEENAIIFERVNGVVKALGAEVVSSSYAVRPEYSYKDGSAKLDGYIVTNALYISYSQLQKLGELVDSLLKAGANNIGSIEYISSQQDELYNQALKQAVLNAQKKAQAIAWAIDEGAKIELVEVTEANSHIIPFRAEAMSLKMSSPSTEIESGEVDVVASINAEFKII